MTFFVCLSLLPRRAGHNPHDYPKARGDASSEDGPSKPRLQRVRGRPLFITRAAHTTCFLRLILVSFPVGVAPVARVCVLFFMIPECSFISLEFDSRRIAAVLVDHNSNVLEPAFCLVTVQQLPSTIHQDGESSKLLAARDSRDNS